MRPRPNTELLTSRPSPSTTRSEEPPGPEFCQATMLASRTVPASMTIPPPELAASLSTMMAFDIATDAAEAKIAPPSAAVPRAIVTRAKRTVATSSSMSTCPPRSLARLSAKSESSIITGSQPPAAYSAPPPTAWFESKLHPWTRVADSSSASAPPYSPEVLREKVLPLSVAARCDTFAPPPLPAATFAVYVLPSSAAAESFTRSPPPSSPDWLATKSLLSTQGAPPDT